jgi:pantetheine-phosphate adenylyltransferase
MNTLAIYPGSFDPLTLGHCDIVRRSLQMFDKVVVAIAVNVRKTPLFSFDERRAMILASLPDLTPRVEVDAFEGLLVNYVVRRGAHTIVRGLRAMADFEFEFQLAHMNRRLAPQVDSLFLMTSEEHHFVSSSLVKEVASFGGDVSGFVPPPVAAALAAHFPRTPKT